MAHILVVDDEIGIRELLSEILADEVHQVGLAESAVMRRLRSVPPGPRAAGHLDAGRRRHHAAQGWAASGQLTMPVVMMSGHATIETAVEATRIGALDFLEKPIALQRLLATVKRALRNPESAATPEFSIAALGAARALAEAKKRLAQLPAPGACSCAASAACVRSSSPAC